MVYRTTQAPGTGPQWCATCGSKLVGGDCVECDRPRSIARGVKLKAVPARAYNEPSAPPPEPEHTVDARRSSAEWMTEAADDAPSTRRAHPTQVRLALAEAEEKARAKAGDEIAQPRPRSADGRGPESRRITAPRVKMVTPLPDPYEADGDDDPGDAPTTPEPQAHAAPQVSQIPAPAPAPARAEAAAPAAQEPAPVMFSAALAPRPPAPAPASVAPRSEPAEVSVPLDAERILASESGPSAGRRVLIFGVAAALAAALVIALV